MPCLDTTEHVLDAKFRAVLPASVRPLYLDGGVLTLWAGPCLAVFTPGAFADWRDVVTGQLAESKFEDAGAHVRYVSARSAPFKVDVQGRFIVPDRLRQAAAIERTITITGAGNRMELWSSAIYHGSVDVAEMEQNITFLQATYDLPRS
ncbi:MAG: hypothetical protein WKF43_11195 [Acidimicrobiales bacterium]